MLGRSNQEVGDISGFGDGGKPVYIVVYDVFLIFSCKDAA